MYSRAHHRSPSLPLAGLKALFTLAAALALSPTSRIDAQITVSGLTDQTVYADHVSFTVPPTAGVTTVAALDGVEIPTGQLYDVDNPDYHELSVEQFNGGPDPVASVVIQFIVRSSERADSEWGLPPWVPYPSIPSAAAEFAGSHLQVMAPASFPQGLRIPVVLWVLDDATGKRVGVNGPVVSAAPFAAEVFLRRGVGSGHLPAASQGASLTYAPHIQTVSAEKDIVIDSSTSWTNVSGTVAATASWGANARVRVTGNLTIPAGVTLTVEAGSVVALAGGVDILVAGTLRVNGTIAQPVTFLPLDDSSPWGGIVLNAAASRAEVTGGIFTGSGQDQDWFGNNPGMGSSHRDEQPCFYVSNGARANLTDSALIDGRGQAGHGESGFFTLERTLIQRFITAGQYNGGAVNFTDSAVIEFPYDGAPFADQDNDAIYMTGGAHFLTNCLVGWSLDDGMDAGSGSAGPVTVKGCWVESTFHEGMAWSETRTPTVSDTVAINCGQGIECGFGEPMVTATRILSTGNATGARFGDNYDWDYNGFLRITDSLILYNYRDVFLKNWSDWTERLAQVDLHANRITNPHPALPDNAVWNPATDAAELEPFLPTPATVVGMGIALRETHLDQEKLAEGVPVRLSTFAPRTVSATYTVTSENGQLETGTVTFLAGETVRRIFPAIPDLAQHGRIVVTLSAPVNAEITGNASATYLKITAVTLIARASEWKYRDTGTNLETAWRELDYNDASWPSGRAVLGFGDNQPTPINGGPSNSRFPTTYFRRDFDVDDPSIFDTLIVRLLRDDGAVVYINGDEVFRSNMPDGTIEYGTHATSSSTSETNYFAKEFDAGSLRAGRNVIAVEVHQATVDSSDLSFDLELIGNSVVSSGPGGFIRGDANGDGGVDIADPVKTLFVLFGGIASDCEDAIDADDNGVTSISDAILVLAYLFQGGAAPAQPFPLAAPDPTTDALDCSRD